MNELDETGSSSGPSFLPSAATGPGSSSGPAGPARRPSSAPTPRTRRIGLATATIAALGTLAIAITAAGTMGGTPSTAAAVDAASIVSATAAAATPAPTEQVVVDTVYVNAPAPKALPPIVVPSKVKATPKPPIRIVKIVPSAGGGEQESGDQGEAESGGGDD
jgi:hypothetical protein